MEANRFYLDDWLVEPDLGKISRSSNTVRLEPQVMKVLVYLASNRGAVTTKQQIMDAVWQRRYTSDAALARCIFVIRQALGDDRRKPRYIQTIPKIGYKLVATVTAIEAHTTVRKNRHTAVTILGLLVLSIGVSAYLLNSPDPGRHFEISATVINSVATEHDAEFVRSVANVLPAELERSIVEASGRVLQIDRHDTTLPLDEPVELRKLSSVIRVEEDQIEIAVTLSNQQDTIEYWQEHYFLNMPDGLDALSLVVKDITTALDLPGNAGINAAPAASMTNNIVAYDAYTKGMQGLREFSVGGNLSAIVLFENAIEQDPTFGLAHAGLSAALSMQVRFWFGKRKTEALVAAQQAIELAPGHADSHYAMGEALLSDSWATDRALQSFNKALAIDPTHVDAMRSSALIYLERREYEKADQLYRAALEMDPDDAYTMRKIGTIYFEMGDFDGARHWLTRAYKGSPFGTTVNSQLATIELMHGDAAKAIQRCDQLTRLNLWSYSCMRVSAASAIIVGDLAGAGNRLQRMSEIWPSDGYVRLARAYVLHAEGAEDEARRLIADVLSEAEAAIKTDSDSHKDLRLAAIAHALLGDDAEAYEILNRPTTAGPIYDPWDEIDPLLSDLRDDHRFKSYLASTKPLYK